ncbi:Por secretion system C-terminal sorting domain-containing protein [Hymenobacter daecheongensis DSM 21074]|uniref:Por secretion system C-terminal sorting domain-containing protein n=1 Tax=Hymenobacter daecheongensis DSM 21074 TaxID=1121955 RepID=A0A1M6ES33_9BACT|nr:DUF4961 domain-containing protein [Hymenobacter daecheongensis]SHI88281.1 Por secretion system C-terminal sorting domain-containing protein [Hymenobacter daecheongensis DSM 21074]
MKTLRLVLCLLALLTGLPAAHAQVVTAQPASFRETDPVTLTFDATQGNAELANFTGDVYIWTGVVTNLSANNTQWRHVKSPAFNQADPAALMTRDATNPNLYRITLTPRTFYPVPANEQILRLGMIFKNADGTKVGRGPAGDIFIDVAQNVFDVKFTNPVPSGSPELVVQNTPFSVTGTSAIPATLTLTLNGVQVAQQTNATSITANVTVTQAGANTLRLTASNGTTSAFTELQLQTRPAVTVAALPAGANKDGITYLAGGTSVILSLTAPNKEFVYAIGEFNNWQLTDATFMNRTPQTDAANGRWWVQINGLTPGQEYAYQYLVNGTQRIADPYTDKVLDPNNDRFIPADTYPGLKAYPAGQTGIVSVLQTNQTAYQWTTTGFQKPKRTDLVVYELLARDFVARHDYQTLRDTLNYLQRLGVNAIELMPFNEFEGNDSWGYNPSFYFAPDKYYGTKNELKRFIDECHRRGIAVIMDMVLNHSCGQSPMVQMYFDGGNPSTDSPWFNRTATHPFNVCYDFNHESEYTKYFVQKVTDYWIQEYKIDGYRFDLSKGFTQVNSGNNVGLWGQYDQSRINIWKNIYDKLLLQDPNVYCILEHFADNSEEKVLADYGMMLWGNMTHNYNEATMGYVSTSNLSGAYHGARNFTLPHLVTYMESHDEERQMYKNITFGNQANPAHDVKNLTTALARSEAATAFFFAVPGPKMVWQFGEVGYDVNIDFNGRTGMKPIRWNYYQEPARRKLYDVYRAMIALKKAEPVFETGTFTQNVSGGTKSIHLTDPSLSVTVVGNFDVTTQSINPEFQRTGKWYNYLTGDSIIVANTTTPLTLQPGQYTVYTSRRIVPPSYIITASKRRQDAAALQLLLAPNPANTQATVSYQLPAPAPVTVTVTNLLGATVRTLPAARQSAGPHSLQVPIADLANGVYLLRLTTGEQTQTRRLVVQH